MASHGYILNATELDKIVAAFRGVCLEEAPLIEPNSVHGALPSSGWFSHVELTVEENVGGVTHVRSYLSWDSAGDELATTIQTIPIGSFAPSPTVPNQYGYDWPVNEMFRVPIVQTTPGTVWAWFAAPGAGALTVKRCRLYWSNPHMRA